ncbi:MAG: winged helix-turn-helix transcriptional regulator [Deltaproteobacteria bacterium]|nr:winged helix-turn-helix transcriptional regulator [Deltaproteobacteria bacterium]
MEQESDCKTEPGADLAGLAALLAVAAHPVRLMILERLQDRVRCVKELNEIIPVSQPNLSQHMAALRHAGLVDFHARGALRCYYVLRPTLVERLLACRPELHPAQPRSRDLVLAELDDDSVLTEMNAEGGET